MISSHKNLLKQIGSKAVKMSRYARFNKPKDHEFGKMTKGCVRCGNRRGHIAKYGLKLCRRCFRDVAPSIGFKKYG